MKHTLRELVTDATPADAILNITLCEPAMGSAAFLNEAVNQLAQLYLERKQRELNQRIDHADYADERLRLVSIPPSQGLPESSGAQIICAVGVE